MQHLTMSSVMHRQSLKAGRVLGLGFSVWGLGVRSLGFRVGGVRVVLEFFKAQMLGRSPARAPDLRIQPPTAPSALRPQP